MIAVKIDNSLQPNSRWYSGSGIYRHVWLTTTSPIHVSQWGTYVTTPKVTAKEAAVKIETTILNESQEKSSLKIVSGIIDKNGNRGCRSGSEWENCTGAQLKVNTSFNIKSPQL